MLVRPYSRSKAWSCAKRRPGYYCGRQALSRFRPKANSTRPTRRVRWPGPNGPALSLRSISACAPPRSTAVPPKCKRTFWRRPCSAFQSERSVDFNLSEEQALLKDAIGKLILKEYSFEQRRRHGDTPEGWSRVFWEQLAGQSFLALPFATEQGGLGGGAQELMLVMEALGRGLVLEPYLVSVVVAGSILRHGASEAQLARLVPQIAAGKSVLALAQTEKQSRYELDNVLTSVTVEGDEYVI